MGHSISTNGGLFISMNQQSPDTVTSIRLALKLPNVSPQVVSQMEEYLAGNNIYTKKEGNKNHVNAFFLPFDKELGRIYLGHHKKADDWIPPGGHIEPGETPEEACIREMQEELSTTIKKHDLELWNLSYKYIGRPQSGCVGHFDLWYLVHTSSNNNFGFDSREYYDAGWFALREGIAKITKNPDFATILTGLFQS